MEHMLLIRDAVLLTVCSGCGCFARWAIGSSVFVGSALSWCAQARVPEVMSVIDIDIDVEWVDEQIDVPGGCSVAGQAQSPGSQAHWECVRVVSRSVAGPKKTVAAAVVVVVDKVCWLQCMQQQLARSRCGWNGGTEADGEKNKYTVGLMMMTASR